MFKSVMSLESRKVALGTFSLFRSECSRQCLKSWLVLIFMQQWWEAICKISAPLLIKRILESWNEWKISQRIRYTSPVMRWRFFLCVSTLLDLCVLERHSEREKSECEMFEADIFSICSSHSPDLRKYGRLVYFFSLSIFNFSARFLKSGGVHREWF